MQTQQDFLKNITHRNAKFNGIPYSLLCLYCVYKFEMKYRIKGIDGLRRGEPRASGDWALELSKQTGWFLLSEIFIHDLFDICIIFA